ncbi:hypothetical protein JGI25_01493, partial [Candidatus Kryptobacter tengchongensis]
KMGETGREKAIREFNLEKMLSKTMEVYYEVLKLKELVKDVKEN